MKEDRDKIARSGRFHSDKIQKQAKLIFLEVQIIVTPGRRKRFSDWRGTLVGLMGAGNVLFLIWILVTQICLLCENLPRCTFMVCALFCLLYFQKLTLKNNQCH